MFISFLERGQLQPKKTSGLDFRKYCRSLPASTGSRADETWGISRFLKNVIDLAHALNQENKSNMENGPLNPKPIHGDLVMRLGSSPNSINLKGI